ncbi:MULTISPECIES: type III secretion system export apparatus subunit SctS [unclassified Mycoavidus]|uniref:type III secretion system export apparatus subunit SctS n=1 Tax=unclassified Mycoavidus TaxID=2649241 RepID=UPI001CBE49B4|nr:MULTISPECIES: type III secretion system export apparatus subunit SctS [unclassified Mycoavidus]UAW64292.1 type III secretion system export apparatus subunit SctS [Mycoavidus sp. HKI]UUM21717.1 type III secretion system export apparatus subunit SctS [Mycoavidus sp. SF9855]
MSDAILIHMTTQLLWVVLLLALPIVVAVAVVSLAVSLMQTLTQLQDQTLQFIFKLLTASLTLLVTYRWIGMTLLNYSDMVFQQLSDMRR